MSRTSMEPVLIRVLVTLLALSAPLAEAAAQTKTYRWEDGLCRHSVRYDPRKVDEQALKSTAEILNTEQGVPIAMSPLTPADAEKLDPAGFETQCAATAARMRAHRLLPLPGIEEYRTERARQIDDACAFGSAQLRSHRDPSALRRYAPAAGRCDRFVDALEGRADLTATWRARITETCARNVDPASCRKRREDEGARPDGEARKRLYLVSFGWGNCATEFAAFNGEGAKRRQAMEEKLTRAFKKAYGVRETCDEP
ncbi:hypothetical protein [Enterovirga rhinocerotis]|uniref:DUF4124 domain-containing protein n=1 Tax=Enterovirga rhinocerotis TaxID=1339210 RepID=A0A4R7BX39_9HYPH|nr:hypothetical protein [Enterovirga rhinocerotis]TDR89772.1 hypothetical protein EV668_2607 [Enterovirga rhinocerotis]